MSDKKIIYFCKFTVTSDEITNVIMKPVHGCDFPIFEHCNNGYPDTDEANFCKQVFPPLVAHGYTAAIIDRSNLL